MPGYGKTPAALRPPYQYIALDIQRLQREIKMWRGFAETVSDEKIDAVIDAMIALLEEKLCIQLKRLILIEQVIKGVKSDRLRRLLWYRYIDGRTFGDIAEKMDLTREWVCHLHKEALDLIQSNGAAHPHGDTPTPHTEKN